MRLRSIYSRTLRQPTENAMFLSSFFGNDKSSILRFTFYVASYVAISEGQEHRRDPRPVSEGGEKTKILC